MAIGKSVPLLDSAARVTGAVEYMINLKLPEILVGKIVRSHRRTNFQLHLGKCLGFTFRSR